MKTVNRRTACFFRTFSITSFMIICAVSLLVSIAYTVTVVEQNAYGRTVEVFTFDDQSFTLLGKKFDIPLTLIVQKAKTAIEKYSLGTIKLLGMAVSTVEELILKLIKLI